MLSKPQGKEAWFPLIFHWLGLISQTTDWQAYNHGMITYVTVKLLPILLLKLVLRFQSTCFLLNLLRWMVIFSNLKRWPVGKLLIILNLLKNSRKEIEKTLFQLRMSEQLKSPLINSEFITMVGFIRAFYVCAPQRKSGFILCRNL